MRKPTLIALFIATLAASLASSPTVRSQGVLPESTLERIAMTKVLVIDGVSGGGRSGGGSRGVAAIDPIQRMFIAGEWRTPKAGDEIKLADDSKRVWTEVEAGDDGALPNDRTRGGYALWLVESDTDKIMLLNARGHGMAYVNGEERAGDPYDNGIVSLPVKLRKGVNEILLQCPRGAVRAELVEPRAKVMLSKVDMTLPDLERDAREEAWAAAVLINASEEVASGLGIDASFDDLAARTTLDPIPPLSVRKIGFRLPRLRHGVDPGEAPKSASVHLVVSDGNAVDRSEFIQFDVGIAQPLAMRKRTFISDIDGSVQYFALRPALNDDPDNALILTLHGASVEATSQAAAYKSKEWAHIVAPTNRRPFGFDWEDWGRLDALEVLAIARRDLPHSDRRVHLTGHSMGGHGTWQIGVTFPGLFAAIAPSAGWISFETYSGGRNATTGDEADALKSIMRRAGNASRTLDLQRNLEGLGVYVLHGDQDDNVPVEQARTMKAELDKWHKDIGYHEQPGAGHWWGDECVDWPPLMAFLKSHERPEERAINRVMFVTASPGVSASRDWVTIQLQQQAMAFSKVDLTRDVAKRSIAGTTENVARLAIDLSAFGKGSAVDVEIDGQRVRAQASPQAAEFVRQHDRWTAADAPFECSHKSPGRCGPFKSAFNHRFMFVYGTKGTPEENAWAINKARFDAESFWYRGNGSIDIVADVDFKPDEAATRDRSVIVYGNAETNAAWDALLSDSPVQVRRGVISIDQRELKGDSLACLFVRPRPGSDIASVGVVSGSGVVGSRITNRLPYFVSGVAYPDCIVLDGRGLSNAGDGRLDVAAAGFFGNDWSVEAGDFAWSK